jgi:hypothetical protein
MSVSTSFGVEQQPVEISEAELSTLPKTQVRPFAHFTRRVGIQTASALESVSLQDFPNQWIPILPNGNCGEYFFRGCYESPELPASRNACLN